MKRHWLRGFLLGVSLAVLLSGGVAVAHGINLTTVREECLECSTDEEHINWLAVHSSGWVDDEWVGLRGDSPIGQCGNGAVQAHHGEFIDLMFFSGDCDADLGMWRFEFENDSGLGAGFSILVAEECPESVEEEFVPEPGTIMLLGSGLAGLAGYAGLRWRTRE